MNLEQMNDNVQRMGLDSARLQHVWSTLNQEVERGNIPGASIIIGREEERLHYVTGYAVSTAQKRLKVERDTLYDCASLTKVVVTLPLILMLIDRGELRLNDPVAEYIPDFAVHEKSAVTIQHLLTHTSGLVEFLNMFSHGWSREEIIAHVCQQHLLYEPGTKMVYSDLGFIMLGVIIEKLYGCSLNVAAEEHLFKPLGMTDSVFCPPESLRDRIAATEYMPEEEDHRWGKVHDENALALGGVSGHAGLFSTADDLASYAQMWLAQGEANGKSILSKAAVSRAVTSYTKHLLQANRGLGWVLKGDRWDASGDWMSDMAYGHTGFTGTSLWVDPASGVYVVLLTNRVHFGRDKSVNRLRAVIHNIVDASVVSYSNT